MSKKPNLPLIVSACLLLAALFTSLAFNPATAAKAIVSDPHNPIAASISAQAANAGLNIYLPIVQNSVIPVSKLTKVNLTKGPELVYTGSSSSMKLFWQWTSTPSFRVDWGTSAAYGSSSAAVNAYDATNRLYAYTISGLTPGTKYYYRVVVGSQYAAGSFLSAPSADATDLKFVSYGDTRTNGGSHNTVASKVVALYQSDPAYQTLLPFEGDAVTDGNTDSYWTNEFFASQYTSIREELANMALLPIMGNHEGSGTLYKRYFPEPFAAGRYWAVDYGPAHFIMLDQYTAYTAGSAQYNWLKSELAGTSKKWKIIVLHEPGWSANGGHPNNTTVQSVLEPLFEQYQVAMVMAGHNHYYARASVNGIQHLTIGTGGAPTYAPASGQPNIVKTYQGYGYAKFAISGSTLTGWFVDINGAVQDTFTVTR